MFAPTKIWRRWHRKINVNEKRYAMVSSLAATAVPALVMARGHRVDNVPEVPLVVDNKAIDNIDKASKAVALLKALSAFEDVEKSKDSKTVRAGKGKARNRRYVSRRGPLVIYNQENSPLLKAFRNLPGVELCNVSRLNVLQLAPGGHLGRFVIWTKDAFEKLDSIYGTYTKLSQTKKDYRLPRPIMANSDLTRIINSEEIQAAIRDPKSQTHEGRKKNLLNNRKNRIAVNPAYASHVRREVLAQEQRAKKKAETVEQKRKGTVQKDPKAAAAKKTQQKRLRKQARQFRTFVSK
jgi:large subunit ribosomal protein L4e